MKCLKQLIDRWRRFISSLFGDNDDADFGHG